MKFYKIIILLSLILGSVFASGQILSDTICSSNVKSVFLRLNGIELSSPIIKMESNDKIQVSFDILDGIGENFRYRILHCNKNWEKDELEPSEYINGFEDGSIDNFKNSFTTLQEYTHYYQSIPSTYSSFVASGNYILEIYPQDEPDSIILRKRFWVTEENASIELHIGKPTGAFGHIQQDQELSIYIKPVDESPISGINRYITVKAQQNNRTDLIRGIPFQGYFKEFLSYNLSQGNVFPGGNCFRYFDMSNIRTPMYNVQRVESIGGEIFAFIRPDENRSKLVYSFSKTLNGGCKINIWDRNDPQIEADYVWVNFSLPMQNPYLDGNIYIIGDLTQWKFDEESRMEWQPQYKAYTKRLYLKQGYYSYQLIFLPKGSNIGETDRIEGNHFETPNDYTVYVYQRTPNDRYDRLIGIKKIMVN